MLLSNLDLYQLQVEQKLSGNYKILYIYFDGTFIINTVSKCRPNNEVSYLVVGGGGGGGSLKTRRRWCVVLENLKLELIVILFH